MAPAGATAVLQPRRVSKQLGRGFRGAQRAATARKWVPRGLPSLVGAQPRAMDHSAQPRMSPRTRRSPVRVCCRRRRRRHPDRCCSPHARRWAWGAAAAQPGGLAYVDDTTLAYLCGSSVVLYQPDTKTQRFVAGAGEGRVTAFAACPARRMLALAQRAAGAEAKATITLFDLQTLKRRKILTAPGEGTKARLVGAGDEMQTRLAGTGAECATQPIYQPNQPTTRPLPACKQEFVSLAFSADGRYLAAQGGAPDWALCLWLWEKSKLVASARTASAPGQTVVQCLFQPGARAGRRAGCSQCVLVRRRRCPPTFLPCLPTSLRSRSCPDAPHACTRAPPAGEDPQYMSVVGEGTCALYQIEAGNSLRAVPTALPRREHAAFTCHAWLADNDAAPGALGLVVGTRRGEVLVVGEGEVRQALALEGGAAVEALAVHSRVSAGRGWLWGWARERRFGCRLCEFRMASAPGAHLLCPLPHQPTACRALWRAQVAVGWPPLSATARPSPTAWPPPLEWSRRAAAAVWALLPAPPLPPPPVQTVCLPFQRHPRHPAQLPQAQARRQLQQRASAPAALRCAPRTRAWHA